MAFNFLAAISLLQCLYHMSSYKLLEGVAFHTVFSQSFLRSQNIVNSEATIAQSAEKSKKENISAH